MTRDDVEELWAVAIADPGRHRWVAERAEEFFGDAENPIVNDGLHSMHALGRPGVECGPEALADRRGRWRRRLGEFDADPDGWMRAYFRRMLADVAVRKGEPAARRFGAQLVSGGHLRPDDVDVAPGST